jgi:hypothetical protein
VRPSHLVAAAVAALAVLSQPRAAEPVPYGGVPDVTTARLLALGAGVAGAVGNDGLILNPAATAMRRRYAAETVGYLDRRGSQDVTRTYGGTVVDNLTSSVAYGLGWLHTDQGVDQGNTWLFSLAGPVADGIFLGATGRYLDMHGVENVSAVTADLGLAWVLSEYLAFGAAGYNLVPVGNIAVAPRGAGVGIALGTDSTVRLTADWRVDLERADKTANRYGVGLEAMLGRYVPLRGGWFKDELLKTSWWSFGAGLLTPTGVGIDVGYRQSIDDPNARTLSLVVKAQFLEI